ncbi:MAG: hypothetical protein ABIE74_09920 [Pseudomonadota bacterium]
MECNPTNSILKSVQRYKQLCAGVNNIPRFSSTQKKGCHAGVYYYYQQLLKTSKQNGRVNFRFNNPWIGQSMNVFTVQKKKFLSGNLWQRISRYVFGSSDFVIRINNTMNRMTIHGGKRVYEYGARCDVPKMIVLANGQHIVRKKNCLSFTQVKKLPFYKNASPQPMCRQSVLRSFPSYDAFCKSPVPSTYHGSCQKLILTIFKRLLRNYSILGSKVSYRRFSKTAWDNNCMHRFTINLKKGKYRIDMDDKLRLMSLTNLSKPTRVVQYGTCQLSAKPIKRNKRTINCVNSSQLKKLPIYIELTGSYKSSK